MTQTRYKRIDTHFRPIDLNLYEFVMNQVNGYGDASQIVREAIECLRLFGSLEAAESTIKIRQSLQVLIAWYAGEINLEQAIIFLGTNDLMELWQQAAKAGKELAK